MDACLSSRATPLHAWSHPGRLPGHHLPAELSSCPCRQDSSQCSPWFPLRRLHDAQREEGQIVCVVPTHASTRNGCVLAGACGMGGTSGHLRKASKLHGARSSGPSRHGTDARGRQPQQPYHPASSTARARGNPHRSRTARARDDPPSIANSTHPAMSRAHARGRAGWRAA